MDAGDDNFLLIDVREPYENQEFNIGGQLVPIASLMEAIPSLYGQKDEEVIVYCRSGNRSGMAKQLLTASGFSNVKNLLGGMLAWRDNIG